MNLRNYESAFSSGLVDLLDRDLKEGIIDHLRSGLMAGGLLFVVHGLRRSDVLSFDQPVADTMNARIEAVKVAIREDARPMVVLDHPDNYYSYQIGAYNGKKVRFWLTAPIDGSPSLSLRRSENVSRWLEVDEIFREAGVRTITFAGQGEGCIAEIQKHLHYPSSVEASLWSLL